MLARPKLQIGALGATRCESFDWCASYRPGPGFAAAATTHTSARGTAASHDGGQHRPYPRVAFPGALSLDRIIVRVRQREHRGAIASLMCAARKAMRGRGRGRGRTRVIPVPLLRPAEFAARRDYSIALRAVPRPRGGGAGQKAAGTIGACAAFTASVHACIEFTGVGVRILGALRRRAGLTRWL